MGTLYMFSVFDSIILGIVQGLTEFLPISSSGHLIIARDVLGIAQEGGLAFDAVLQLATACAVLLYFRKDIWDLIQNLFSRTKDKAKTNLTLCLIVGTIPALVLGLILEEYMETVFRNISLVALTLIIGSLIMMIADKMLVRHPRGGGDPGHIDNLTIFKSIIIGLFQSLALVPGMSRSGMTISGGYFLGLSKDAAVRFSFLLSIPIIVGSGILKLIDIIQNPSLVSGGIATLVFGFISAFIFGWLAIDFLLKFLKTNSFAVFIVYRVVLAGALLIWFV
jgi:undecaprenyl-diphosphatase